MGILLSRMRGSSSNNDWSLVLIDFESAKPTTAELPIYSQCNAVLERSKEILKLVETYSGSQSLVRAAMQNPTPATELDAFNHLLPNVNRIATFYRYSLELQRIEPPLLTALAADPQNTRATFEDQQSLAVQLGEVFNFALSFDAIRIQKPEISNDLSFYRRLAPKFSSDPRIQIRDEELSSISSFCSLAVPMTSVLARTASTALQSNPLVINALSTMAVACRAMIESKRFVRYTTNLFIARAMTGAIVVFDNVDYGGAFRKGNPTETKRAVQTIISDFPEDKRAMLDALHYSTKHFDTASPKLAALFT